MQSITTNKVAPTIVSLATSLEEAGSLVGTLAGGYGEENIYRGTITRGEDLFVSFFSCPHPVLCPAAPNIFTSTKQYNCTASSSRGRRCGGLLTQLSRKYFANIYAVQGLGCLCWASPWLLAWLNTAYCNFIAYKVLCIMMSGGGDEALESCFIAHFTAIQHFQVLFEDIKRNHTLTFRDTLTSSLASLN